MLSRRTQSSVSGWAQGCVSRQRGDVSVLPGVQAEAEGAAGRRLGRLARGPTSFGGPAHLTLGAEFETDPPPPIHFIAVVAMAVGVTILLVDVPSDDK